MFNAIGEVSATEVSNTTWHLAVYACGFETRARAFVERNIVHAERSVALLFPDRRVRAFKDNVDAFTNAGCEFVDIVDVDTRFWMTQCLDSALLSRTVPFKIFVDISSMTRTRIASILEALVSNENELIVEVTFGYWLADFEAPSSAEAPNVAIGPVSAFFAGWREQPELPTALVAGLGYEQDRALGAFEHLEPSFVWLLKPKSAIHAYTEAVARANRQLLEIVPDNRIIEYDVQDPNQTYAILASLVMHLSANSNVLIVPSGPKILVLLALILASSRRDLAVWKVSAGVDELPSDTRASIYPQFFSCEVRAANSIGAESS